MKRGREIDDVEVSFQAFSDEENDQTIKKRNRSIKMKMHNKCRNQSEMKFKKKWKVSKKQLGKYRVAFEMMILSVRERA